MAKKVFYDSDARNRVLGGAELLYKAVKTTLGPKGRNVVISKLGNPTVTKDGVTVAKNIDLADVDDETLGYKVGSELIKQAASKLNDVAGDGTTTVTILTYHILNEANKLIAAGHDPLELRKGLESAAKEVLDSLQGLSEDIKDNKKRLAEVATISASDPAIGNLVAEVVGRVGKDGVVTVEASQGLETESEVLEGFTFDRGFVSPYFVTDQNRMEAVYKRPAIIVTDKKIGAIQEFVPLLEKLAQSGRKDLILICDDVGAEALGALIINKIKGTFNSVVVKAPGFGERRQETLSDIAVLTGAKVISDETNDSFEIVDLSYVGSAQQVIVTKDKTTIVEGSGDSADLKKRIDQLNSQVKEAKSEYDKENLEKRRAALQGKVAVIKVGGATETEIEEKKFRVDDAVAAVKAAMDEGVVAGGGVTLVNLAKTINSGQPSAPSTGQKLLHDALEQPFRCLLDNSGIAPDAWIEQVRNSKPGFGLDISQSEAKLVDLKAVGVVDPTRVVREVVQNAVSIAGTSMTMGALVVDVPEEDRPPQGGMPMGMM